MVLIAFTVCAVPTMAEESWEFAPDDWSNEQSLDIDPADAANEILNDSDQADLIQLVVFAFTIGIIMTILGFAMGMMYTRRR